MASPDSSPIDRAAVDRAAINRAAVAAWIAADPDPATRAELSSLDDTALADRFADRLHFGTAGLRGPVRAGPNGMNRAVVTRTTSALARWLDEHGHAGGVVVVGRDARHGSREFFADTVAVMRRAGFDVVALDGPVPTPVLAFTTRRLGAVAGVMITASHNPPADNGYKVYLGGDAMTAGAQLVPPVDGEIEAILDALPMTEPEPPLGPIPTDRRARDAVSDYLARLTDRFGSRPSSVRVALTPMHGVGGDVAVAALAAAGFTDVTVVTEQFAPDPDFPTVAFPNPEEPGAADLLLALAERIEADVAIALDPDADRCAVGAQLDGRWRMLTGDETGALLATAVLADTTATDALVATTIVSSTLLGRIAESFGARHVRTLTGFKWLVRAGDGLRYAYEEAIGHCVDPDAVRDKDGISAAVAVARIADGQRRTGASLADALDDVFVRHGVHRTAQIAVRTDDVADIAALMDRLRHRPPDELAGVAVSVTDHATRDDGLRTDAVEFRGAPAEVTIRVVVRPSGTEPKVKFYLEVAAEPGDAASLHRDTARVDGVLDRLRADVHDLTGSR